jgi:hypothetical protein
MNNGPNKTIRFGYLALFLAGAAGLIAGLVLGWPNPIRFVGRDEARQIALEEVLYSCVRDHDGRKSACPDFHATQLGELVKGWDFEIASSDNRCRWRVRVDRAGGFEYFGYEGPSMIRITYCGPGNLRPNGRPPPSAVQASSESPSPLKGEGNGLR